MTNSEEYLDRVLAEYGGRVYSVRNAPKDAVYIGRGKNSIFGNPFPMRTEEDRLKVCMDYARWLAKEIKINPDFAEKVKDLDGKNVACFCSNGTTSREAGARWCHGHTLLACAKYLNEGERK